MLKSYGVGGARVYVVEPESMCGGLQHFSVSPRPLGFGFGTKGFGAKGLGPGLDNRGRRFRHFVYLLKIYVLPN